MTKLPKFLVRFACWVLCMGSVVALVQPVGAVPEISKAYPQYLYTVPVYSRASDTSTVIGWLENGSALAILAEQGEYYQIDCYDTTGYIAKNQTNEQNDRYYVNCDPETGSSGVIPFKAEEELIQLRESLLEKTQQQLGDPYVFGGSTPGGFDCSGLVYYVYGKHDFVLQRGASDQMSAGVIVDSKQMEIGDLVFFRDPGSAYLATHVGIYVGDNRMIHAGSVGISYAELDGVWYAQHFVGARRVVTADPADARAEYEAALL